ncbi:pectate lyase [Olivibacter sp. SDN3]|uniref:pectate lyase n=1 Tax=Olivibacter sp. SDN3 TaxID=2764720 RepID=UPI001650DD90|nr:pectate lyase [Olivibacter sp. SDN3]QNL49267.1 pectate lyase [Olivibacter sp. SDN3]
MYASLFQYLINILIGFSSVLYCEQLFAQRNLREDLIANNMLALQRNYGGWSKFFNQRAVRYDKPLTDHEIALAKAQQDKKDATIDNDATSKEIRYLLWYYHKTQDNRYLKAVKNGIDYLLRAQYANGGWPQYYPDTSLYRAQITYNDCAMINVLSIIRDIVYRRDGFDILATGYRRRAKSALDKGIQCILQTQVVIDGKKTIWAAQYDKKLLVPAQARSYELPSLAAAESSDILLFLMSLPSPSVAIKHAIEAGTSWFEKHKIQNKTDTIVNGAETASGRDRILIKRVGAITWARFYDLNKQEPLFAGRDGTPQKELTSIEDERRLGYAWYGNWGIKVKQNYQIWKKRTPTSY